MKSMEHTRGELLPVFGAAAVAFTFSLAAAFDWPWWGLLVAVAAVATVLSLCGSSAKSTIEGGCAGVLLALAVLGLVAGRASIPSALASVEGFLASHATAVQAGTAVMQAGAAVAMILLTYALWRATRSQAEATKALRELQEELVKSEASSLLVAPKIEVINHLGETREEELGVRIQENSSIELVFKPLINVGKYGVLLRRIELIGMESSEDPKWKVFGWEEVATPILAGKSKMCTIKVEDRTIEGNKVNTFFSLFFLENKLTEDGVLAQVLLKITYLYGGSAFKESCLCFRLRPVRASLVSGGGGEASVGEGSGKYVFAAVPVQCPATVEEVV